MRIISHPIIVGGATFEGGVMSKPSKRERWQGYVDDSLLKTGQVSEAAIHGLDGKRWASSPGLQITPSQIRQVVANITGEESLMRKNGIKFGAEHYIFLRSEAGRLMLGRKGSDSGVCVVKTRSAVLVGTYTAGIQPAQCSGVMERMGDYLIQHNL